MDVIVIVIMSKGLINNFPLLAQEMTKTPKDQKPKASPGWLHEMVAAGKVFDRNMKLFGDYFAHHQPSHSQGATGRPGSADYRAEQEDPAAAVYTRW